MKVTVDRSVCVGAGMCVLTSSAVFDQSDDDGTVVLLESEPPEGEEDNVREAAQLCPSQAITVSG